MVSIAPNKSLRIAPPLVITTRDFHTSAASVETAAECDRRMLQAAKGQFQRQLAWNRRSMTFGLFLGIAALACCIADPWAYWPLAVAAAAELGFVPGYTTVQSRRLRRLITLIDLDLEEGLVRDGNGTVRRLFDVWPVLEDRATRIRRLAAAGRAAFAGLRPGARITYRLAARSRLVLSIEPEECPKVSPPPYEVGHAHPHHIRWDFYCQRNLQSPPQTNQPVMTLMGTDG